MPELGTKGAWAGRATSDPALTQRVLLARSALQHAGTSRVAPLRQRLSQGRRRELLQAIHWATGDPPWDCHINGPLLPSRGRVCSVFVPAHCVPVPAWVFPPNRAGGAQCSGKRHHGSSVSVLLTCCAPDWQVSRVPGRGPLLQGRRSVWQPPEPPACGGAARRQRRCPRREPTLQRSPAHEALIRSMLKRTLR